MAEPNLKEVHDVLVALAKEAGDLVITATPSATTSDTKFNCNRNPQAHLPDSKLH
jgi:hypothetical protein